VPWGPLDVIHRAGPVNIGGRPQTLLSRRTTHRTAPRLREL